MLLSVKSLNAREIGLAENISYCIERGIVYRELWDVKHQLMSLDGMEEEKEWVMGGSDLIPNVYEGGFKIWEGSWDLVEFIKNEKPASLFELGCGAGLPALSLLLQSLQRGERVKCVFADYNESVLKMLVLPNIFLVYLYARHPDLFTGEQGSIESDGYIEEFREALEISLDVHLIHGPWGKEMAEMVGKIDLVLSSETIYSVEQMPTFLDTVEKCMNEKAIISAKSFYFGVGGGVNELLEACEARGLHASIAHTQPQGFIPRMIVVITGP